MFQKTYELIGCDNKLRFDCLQFCAEVLTMQIQRGMFFFFLDGGKDLQVNMLMCSYRDSFALRCELNLTNLPLEKIQRRPLLESDSKCNTFLFRG